MDITSSIPPESTSGFVHTRLRGYAGKIESTFDPRASLANSIALSGFSSPASVSPRVLPPVSVRDSGSLKSRSQQSSPGPASPVPTRPDDKLQSALAEVATLRSEVAGMEEVLSYMKGAHLTTVMGRKAPLLPTQEQLRTKASIAVNGGAGVLMTSSAFHSGAIDGGKFDELIKGPLPFTRRSWQSHSSPVPVGRGEAVILAAALEEALPRGVIAAKYTAGFADKAAASGPAAMFLAAQDVRNDLKMLEAIQREAARQVSYSCSERGTLLVSLAERYAEVVTAALVLAQSAVDERAGLIALAKEAKVETKEVASKVGALEEALAAKQAEIEAGKDEVVLLHTKMEHMKQDAERHVEMLKRENEVLAAEVQAALDEVEAGRGAQESALEAGLEDVTAQLEKVIDERDDMLARLKFMESHMRMLRDSSHKTVPLATISCQTDAIVIVVEQQEVVATLDDELPELPAQTTKAPVIKRSPKKEQRIKELGVFAGLIQLEKVGRPRGRSWLLNVLGPLYYDKIINDSIADREGNPRLSLPEFVFDWHLTKFGLRRLAESSLLDVLASARAHYKSSQRIRWFANFSSLAPGQTREKRTKDDTTHQVSFYLFTLQQLAAPNAITALFPESDEPVSIKAATVPEAIRAIFKYLNDADAANSFIARVIDPMVAEAVAQSSGPKMTEILDSDRLIAVLMAEFSRRQTKTIGHLRALFKAGDVDKDNLLSYDEFVATVKSADPNLSDRRLSRMYSEAIMHLETGVSLIDVDTFVTTMRIFGYDRWKIDTSMPLPGIPPPAPGNGAPTQQPAPDSKALFRMLDGSLDSLVPPLGEQVGSVIQRCSTPEPQAALMLLVERHKHFELIYNERQDAQAAWLAFRMLLASLVSFTAGRISTAQSRNVDSQGRKNFLSSMSWRGSTQGIEDELSPGSEGNSRTSSPLRMAGSVGSTGELMGLSPRSSAVRLDFGSPGASPLLKSVSTLTFRTAGAEYQPPATPDLQVEQAYNQPGDLSIRRAESEGDLLNTYPSLPSFKFGVNSGPVTPDDPSVHTPTALSFMPSPHQDPFKPRSEVRFMGVNSFSKDNRGPGAPPGAAPPSGPPSPSRSSPLSGKPAAPILRTSGLPMSREGSTTLLGEDQMYTKDGSLQRKGVVFAMPK